MGHHAAIRPSRCRQGRARRSTGSPFGVLADSGDASSVESHLHLGLKRGDVYLDPTSLLLAAAPASAATPQEAPAAAPAPAPAPMPAQVPTTASGDRACASFRPGRLPRRRFPTQTPSSRGLRLPHPTRLRTGRRRALYALSPRREPKRRRSVTFLPESARRSPRGCGRTERRDGAREMSRPQHPCRRARSRPARTQRQCPAHGTVRPPGLPPQLRTQARPAPSTELFAPLPQDCSPRRSAPPR